MKPDDIMKAMVGACRKLSDKTEDYQNLQQKRAEAERLYNIAFASKVLELKGKEAATLIPKLAAGDEKVADLKFKMDVAEAVARACKESMEALKTAINTYQSILAWERQTYEKGDPSQP